MKRKATLSIALAAVLGCGLVTVTQVANGAQPQAEQPVSSTVATSVQPEVPTSGTNDRGQTFGSLQSSPDGEGYLYEESPDLVAAYSDDGVLGYVDKDVFFGKTDDKPKNPAEAVEMMNRGTAKSYPVYASDGVTVLGKLTESDQNPVGD